MKYEIWLLGCHILISKFNFFQANRKQSMNYGCIVENETTKEVSSPSYLLSTSSHSLLSHLKITTTLLFYSGLALCGKAEHICERHHKLRHIPLHPGNLPAYRCCLSEEPAGHVVVSWSSPSWGCVCVGMHVDIIYCISLLSLHLSFFLPFSSLPWLLFAHTIIRYPYDG